MVKSKEKSEFSCEKCGEEFPGQAELNGHKRYQNHRDSDI